MYNSGASDSVFNQDVELNSFMTQDVCLLAFYDVTEGAYTSQTTDNTPPPGTRPALRRTHLVVAVLRFCKPSV